MMNKQERQMGVEFHIEHVHVLVIASWGFSLLCVVFPRASVDGLFLNTEFN